jgi:hypothetical protein
MGAPEGRSPYFSCVGASAIGLYDVRGVQKENGAHCQPDPHGAAGEKPFSSFKPLVLAEMQPGHFSDLMLGQAELHTSGHENFSLIQNGGVLPVFCLRVLKRNTIPHVTPRPGSDFWSSAILFMAIILPSEHAVFAAGIRSCA